MLRHQAPTLLVTLLTIALTVYLYIIVPKGFFPQQDTGRLNGQILADQDTSFQKMARLLSQYAEVVGKDPGVASVLAFAGGQANTARMFVDLKPLAERKVNADAVVARIRRQAARISGASLYLQAVQDLRIGGRMGAAQYQYTLRGDNLEDLSEWAPKMLAGMRSLPGLADVNSDQQNRGLQAKLVYDRNTAARFGITSQMIDSTLYDAFGQRQVSTMYTQLNQYHVVMEAEPRLWQNPDGLRYIYVRGRNGAQVPLSALAHYAPDTAPLAVNHTAQFPSVTISFNLAPLRRDCRR